MISHIIMVNQWESARYLFSRVKEIESPEEEKPCSREVLKIVPSQYENSTSK